MAPKKLGFIFSVPKSGGAADGPQSSGNDICAYGNLSRTVGRRRSITSPNVFEVDSFGSWSPFGSSASSLFSSPIPSPRPFSFFTNGAANALGLKDASVQPLSVLRYSPPLDVYADSEESIETVSETVSSPSERSLSNGSSPLVSGYITCPKCTTSYAVKETDIGDSGRVVKCTKCEFQWNALLTDIKALSTASDVVSKSARGVSPLNIYVGNLSFKATEDDLRSTFEAYGDVHRVSIPLDRETGRSRGFAFVEMQDRDSGLNAIEQLNGTSIAGRQVNLSEAKPRESTNVNPNGNRSPAVAGGGYNSRKSSQF
eukprot:CAMPEP_0184643436 /NCGR_PEP_ID=MMETSP0308-20130426/276_1 /TAXON_ID=38269 /ORGANISM="Gloeochaete witrockiana, Strain SAG 46.84" /LENGTH=313 /DNA_ID=CAMNT_0027071371 /DNA_START=190 /DNA_END=1131 /DNA_ORIENTATION=-